MAAGTVASPHRPTTTHPVVPPETLGKPAHAAETSPGVGCITPSLQHSVTDIPIAGAHAARPRERAIHGLTKRVGRREGRQVTRAMGHRENCTRYCRRHRFGDRERDFLVVVAPHELDGAAKGGQLLVVSFGEKSHEDLT